jgi:hypothetical protein
MATFEAIDGSWLKEYVWHFNETSEAEEIDFYRQASGLDSEYFMFTFGLPLYPFWICVVMGFILPFSHAMYRCY